MLPYRQKVYCEAECLKEICDKAEDKSVSCYEVKKVCRALFHFLCTAKIELHINISISNADFNGMPATTGKANSLYERLLCRFENDAYTQGRLTCENDFGGLFSETEQLSADALYLTMLDAELCLHLSQKTGCLVVSPYNIDKFTPLTNDSGIAIVKNEPGTWLKILDSTFKIEVQS